MENAVKYLQNRFLVVREGDVFYDVDATRIHEGSAVGEAKVTRVGREYVYFRNGCQIRRDTATTLLDNVKQPNYRINRKHHLFATWAEAETFLEEKRSEATNTERRNRLLNEFSTLALGRVGWSFEKMEKVIAAMKESEATNV